MKEKVNKRKILIQKIWGVVLLIMTYIICFTDVSYVPEIGCRDVTVALFTLPMGIWLLITKKEVMTL